MIFEQAMNSVAEKEKMVKLASSEFKIFVFQMTTSIKAIHRTG
jgi:hypothetical protein